MKRKKKKNPGHRWDNFVFSNVKQTKMFKKLRTCKYINISLTQMKQCIK